MSAIDFTVMAGRLRCPGYRDLWQAGNPCMYSRISSVQPLGRHFFVEIAVLRDECQSGHTLRRHTCPELYTRVERAIRWIPITNPLHGAETECELRC